VGLFQLLPCCPTINVTYQRIELSGATIIPAKLYSTNVFASITSICMITTRITNPQFSYMYVIHSIQEANRVHGTEEEKIFRERYAQELQKKKMAATFEVMKWLKKEEM
jgi:hypothetical protein